MQLIAAIVRSVYVPQDEWVMCNAYVCEVERAVCAQFVPPSRRQRVLPLIRSAAGTCCGPRARGHIWTRIGTTAPGRSSALARPAPPCGFADTLKGGVTPSAVPAKPHGGAVLRDHPTNDRE